VNDVSRKISTVALRLLVVLGIAGMSNFSRGQDLGQVPARSSIVIGVSNVQSGPSRALGEKLVEGSLAYFDIVNHT